MKPSKSEIMEKLQKATGFDSVEELKRLEFIIDEINDSLNFDSSKKVLEIGCGNGNVCMGIASMGYQTLGVDIDEESIRRAQANNNMPNLEFKAEPAENLSEGDKFDAIVCTEVLEHLVDPTVVLEYALKYLKKDGVFISTVPNGYGPREVLMTKPQQFLEQKELGERLVKFKRVFGYGHGTVQSSNPNLEHIQFFSKKRIIQLHEDSGFRLKRFNHADSFGNIFPYSILTRRVKKLQELDCAVADLLPSAFTSGFYMSYLRK
jgi:2-polyprenyl-3-methyl-5-hydroxy-6-metoxy-1,4-benzoquinol methylase